MPPQFKPQNIATALMVINEMQLRLPVSVPIIQQGVLDCRLPGRFEVIHEKPTIIVDVGHNPAATTWLATQLKNVCKDQPIIAVFGAMKDKAIEEMIIPMLPVISTWCVVDLSIERAEKASALANILSRHRIKKCYTFPAVSNALDAMVNQQPLGQTIVVFGSFYTVSDAKQWMLSENTQGVLIWN